MGKFRIILRITILVLGALIVGLYAFRLGLFSPPSIEAKKWAPPQYGVIGNFSFQERSGKTVSRSDLLGDFWVADFIFTRCMGPCPLLTARMAKLQEEFKQNHKLKFVSFTVDPEYDSADVLTRYAETYKANKDRWLFLTGQKKEIYNLIRSSFHLAVEPDEKDPMQVVHSLSFVLVGKGGEILGYYDTNDPEALQNLLNKLRHLS